MISRFVKSFEVGEWVVEMTTERSTTERWPIAAGTGLGPVHLLVTDGGRSASDGNASGVITQVPPEVMVTRVTGAGDTFMAAHIVAERGGVGRDQALAQALRAAALYVSGDGPL